jgi:hypothetical protein
MKLSTKAMLASVALSVGTMPTAVGATSISSPMMMKVVVPCHVSVSYMKAEAKRLGRATVLSMYGSNKEWKALFTLWNRESRWDYTAKNDKSSAFGIPQILGMSRHTTMPEQIRLGLKYIQHRYGTPTRALAFHQRNGWY